MKFRRHSPEGVVEAGDEDQEDEADAKNRIHSQHHLRIRCFVKMVTGLLERSAELELLVTPHMLAGANLMMMKIKIWVNGNMTCSIPVGAVGE
jgi:hypothetical protein